MIEAIENFCIDVNTIMTLLQKRDVNVILQWCDTLIRLNTLDMAIETALDDWVNKERSKRDV